MTLAEFLLDRIVEEATVWEAPDHPILALMAKHLLADCDAKRRIVELHNRNHECSQYDHTGDIDNCTWFVLDEDGCSTTRLLALPYADHDDYDERWRL